MGFSGAQGMGFERPAPVGENTAFNRSVLSLLERVEYRRCEAGEDIESIMRLRYKAYRSQSLVGEIPAGLVTDSLDGSPNCHLFGIYIDGRLASTVRLHHISAAEPFGPAMIVFPDILGPMIERGETFVQPSQFTADPDVGVNALAIPYLSMRLTTLATVHFNATGCAGVIRKEHTAFYHRIFEAEQVGDARPFPPFTPLVMLYMAYSEQSLHSVLRRFSFLRSSGFERRMLFDKARRGESSPLTILPTAKYVHLAA